MIVSGLVSRDLIPAIMRLLVAASTMSVIGAVHGPSFLLRMKGATKHFKREVMRFVAQRLEDAINGRGDLTRFQIGEHRLAIGDANQRRRIVVEAKKQALLMQRMKPGEYIRSGRVDEFGDA